MQVLPIAIRCVKFLSISEASQFIAKGWTGKFDGDAFEVACEEASEFLLRGCFVATGVARYQLLRGCGLVVRIPIPDVEIVHVKTCSAEGAVAVETQGENCPFGV